jgi:hypothetical protein
MFINGGAPASFPSPRRPLTVQGVGLQVPRLTTRPGALRTELFVPDILTMDQLYLLQPQKAMRLCLDKNSSAPHWYRP